MPKRAMQQNERRGHGKSEKTCVVAGGAGFLGSHLCEALLSDGAEVICIDNFRTGRAEICGIAQRSASIGLR